MEYFWYIVAALGADIGTATAASLVSAQFANRVNNRTVGRVTGVILTILGAAMIYLNYFH
ncbi:MAG: hypothetical protein LUD73_01525 [Lachnospiraceae bacterium]|nr:hypothetical protein [Lachnospiraceae bacterium]